MEVEGWACYNVDAYLMVLVESEPVPAPRGLTHETGRSIMASLQTPLCRVLNIDIPIVQAPIGQATNPVLVAAVSNAGGLGMLAFPRRR